MKLLLKNAKVFHPSSPHHGKRMDILIKNKTIEKIGKNLKTEDAKEIKSKNLCVSVGWMDLGVQTGDPGFEHRDDLDSISAAAAAGGFTAIAPFPNTAPVIQSKSEVQYVLNKTDGKVVDFHPIGALTKNCEGLEITEMHDMRAAGAVAFSDGNQSIQHSGVLLRALEYVTAFGGLVMHQPFDKSVGTKGQIHEGEISTMLGMRGFSSVSENLMIQRDLNILGYSDSRLHFTHVSTKEGVDLVRKAKKQGLKVTAGVPAINLLFDDSAMMSFNTNLKVFPPLREKKDIAALKKGIKDGTIDCIISNHIAHDVEHKSLEFANADFGAIGLQTSFATARMAMNQSDDLDALIEKFATGARTILQLPIPKIESNAAANLTIFDPDMEWTLETSDIKSKSHNSPFIDQSLTGKVIAVVNNGKVVFN